MKLFLGVKKSEWLMVAALMALVAAVYGISLRGVFLWDDVLFIEQNAFLHDVSNIPEIFASDDAVGTGLRNPYYRPVTTATFLMDHLFWGKNPAGYRATNLLLHAAVCVALFFTAKRFMGKWAAFLAAAIFSVHPANSEPVAYISARADLICGLFVLLSFLNYLIYEEKERGRNYAYSVLFFAVALLSKIIALVVPVVLAFWLFARGKRGRITTHLPLYVAIAALFMILRSSVTAVDTFHSHPLVTRLASAGTYLVYYLRYSLLPFGLKVFYEEPIRTTFADAFVIASWAALFLIWATAYRLARRFPEGVLGVVWYFTALLPASGVFMILFPAVMADRYLYIPLLGLSLTAGWMIDRFARSGAYRKNRLQLKACAAICIAAASIYTVTRVNVWGSKLSFWGKAVSEAPNVVLVLNNYGLALINAKRYFEADSVFYQLKEMGDDDAHVDMSLALSAMYRGDLDLAESHITTALNKKPGNSWYLAVNGRISFLKGNIPFAKYLTEASLRLNPYGTEALETMEMINNSQPR
ncbi:hypothetical protein EPN96_02540 [bacterium]|nr:MAG: hypothetical protein EPN96_02540 [bacterium]